MMNKSLIVLVFLVFSLNLAAFSSSVWVTSWDLTSKDRIDQLVKDCEKYKIDEIMAEVRYRGDALYFPNRKDITFSNPEPRSYLLGSSEDFDPLDYLIRKTKRAGIEVHAWVTVFVVTTHKIEQLPQNHVFYTHPEWFTRNFQK